MTRTKSGALVEGPPPFVDFQMASCTNWHAALWRLIVIAFMVGAFSRYVCARVWIVVEGALIGRSVPVSLCKFAIIQLAVYEFE